MVYKTKGVCSRSIEIELEGDTVKSVTFNGGCNGNTKGISSLVRGMKVDEVITIIADHSKKRKQMVPSSASYGVGMYTTYPVEVQIGGATIFVMDVERFEKV